MPAPMPAPISGAEFRAVMAQFASGVTVVTTVDASGASWGMTVSAFSSLSLDPPLCLVCIDRRAGSLEPLRASRRMAINILSDGQADLSGRFATRAADRFAGLDWTPAPVTGSPVFPGCAAWMDCRVTEIVTGGDHEVLFGELLAVEVGAAKPLVNWNGAYADLTSRPKTW